MQPRIARIIFRLYVLAAVFALALVPISLFELFGVARDPLSALPAFLLGAPLSFVLAFAFAEFELPRILYALFGVLPLAVNAWLLWRLQRRLERRAQP
ncbi:MAG TPA: hypothetical protein VNR41_05590 [Xanthobacteraceae bacterium]|jgi:hypothetical protein|nr:hypothetical protein [Xanthobacteraceae bacterium]